MQRKTIVLIVLLVVLVAGIAMFAWNNLTSRETAALPTVVIVTATPSNMMTATPPFSGQAPTATPVMGIENFSEIAGYGHWSTLKRVGGEVEVEKLNPPTSSSCAVRIKGSLETLITNVQCIATDERGVSFVVPWPGWVDSCKIVRFITPAITEAMTLTVDVSNQSTMYITPGKHERIECVIGNRGYQAGDTFPVPGGVSYIIDLSSEDGKNGWVIGANSFYPTDVFGWVRVNENGTFEKYKEFRKNGMVGGWWVWGNTLYITMADFSHICVDLANPVPEAVECNP